MLLEILELISTIDIVLWFLVLVGPYFLGTLCAAGAIPYTNDCVAYIVGTSTPAGNILTIMVQALLTIVGLYYMTPRVFGKWSRGGTFFSGDWKGLVLSTLFVCLGIAGIVWGAIYFHLI